MPNKSFGMRLREQRKLQGLTIEGLADKLHISAHFLGDIERGLKYPSMDLFITILNVMDVSADYLLHDSSDPSIKASVNEMSKKMDTLTPEKQRAALGILDSVIDSLNHLD